MPCEQYSFWNGSEYGYYGDWTVTGSALVFWPQVPGTWYRWWVRARGAAWGAWSASHAQWVDASQPAPAPAGLQPAFPAAGWAVSGRSSVDLAWTSAPGGLEHEVVAEVWDGAAYAPYFTWKTGPASGFTFWPARPGTWYRWWVRARTGAGWSAWSSAAEMWFGGP